MEKERLCRRIRQSAIAIAQTRIESIRKWDITRNSLRLYHDARIGVAGTLGSDSDQLERRAREALDSGISYPYEPSASLERSLESFSELSGDDGLIEETDAILAHLRTKHSRFSFSNKVRLTRQTVDLSNDRNLDLHHDSSHLCFELIFKERDSGTVLDAWVGYTGRRYDRSVLLGRIDEICEAYGNEVELPAGKRFPVIFWPGSDHPPLSFFGNALNGQAFGTRTSLLAQRRGEKVFNEAFTLYQSFHPDDSFGPFFDDEGVVNEGYRYALIDRGLVVTPYTDKRTAATYDLPLTGSAGASYDGVPALVSPSLYVQPGDRTMKELLGGGRGILAMISLGGDFTSEGDFAAPVQLAMLFDGERLLGRLPELQISSNVFDMFGKGFIGVGKDLAFSLANEHLLAIELEVTRL